MPQIPLLGWLQGWVSKPSLFGWLHKWNSLGDFRKGGLTMQANCSPGSSGPGASAERGGLGQHGVLEGERERCQTDHRAPRGDQNTMDLVQNPRSCLYLDWTSWGLTKFPHKDQGTHQVNFPCPLGENCVLHMEPEAWASSGSFLVRNLGTP